MGQRNIASACGVKVLLREADLPLANLESVLALFKVQVDMVLMVPVRARAEHRRETAADTFLPGLPEVRETFTSVGSIVLPLTSVIAPMSSALALPCSLMTPPTILLRLRQW